MRLLSPTPPGCATDRVPSLHEYTPPDPSIMNTSPELSPSSTLSLSMRSSTTALSLSHEALPQKARGLAARRCGAPPPLQIATTMPPFSCPAIPGPVKAALPRRRARKVFQAKSPAPFFELPQSEVQLSDVSIPETAQDIVVHASDANDPSPPPSQARPTTFVGTGRSPPIPLRVVIKPTPTSEPIVAVKPARTQLPRRKARKILDVPSPGSAAPAQEDVVLAELADGPSPPPSQARPAEVVGSGRHLPVPLTLVTNPIPFSGPAAPRQPARAPLPRRKTRKSLDADLAQAETEPVLALAVTAVDENVVTESPPITYPTRTISSALETPTLQLLQAAAGLSRASEWKPAGSAPKRLPRRRNGRNSVLEPIKVIDFGEVVAPEPVVLDHTPAESASHLMDLVPRGLPRMKRASRRRFPLSEAAESLASSPHHAITSDSTSLLPHSRDVGSCLQRLADNLYIAFADGPAPAPAITQLFAPTPISACPGSTVGDQLSFSHVISIMNPGRGRRPAAAVVESTDQDHTCRLRIASEDLTADDVSQVFSFLSAAASSSESRILISAPGLYPGAGMILAALHLSRAREGSLTETLRAIDEDDEISGFWKHVADEEAIERVASVLDTARISY